MKIFRSPQKTVRKSSESPQKVLRKSPESLQKVLEKVFRRSSTLFQLHTLHTCLFLSVLTRPLRFEMSLKKVRRQQAHGIVFQVKGYCKKESFFKFKYFLFYHKFFLLLTEKLHNVHIYLNPMIDCQQYHSWLTEETCTNVI